MTDKVTKCLGLIRQYNPLDIPPGALLRANNCRIPRENVIEDRRGNKLYATLDTQGAQLLTYSSRVLVHKGSTIAYDNGSGTFTDYSGSYAAPTNSRIRGVQAYSNLYATTSLGVKVFSDVAGTAARLAGAPRALDPSYSLTGSTGFLADVFQCAYRAVIQRTDANNNIVTGYPSQRLWVINSAGGARNVALTLYLPSEAQAGDVVQFYRTEQVSGVSSDDAGDEMALVYQVKLVTADITATFITFTDSVTDALMGATLYTSPSQEGITQANERPPVAKDVCLYRSKFMLYGNCSTKQRLYFTLVGVGALGHTATGDTHSNTTLDNVSDVTFLQIGWKVTGTGIPANTTIAGISGTTVTLSQAATATSAGVTITFVTNDTLILGGTTYNFGTTEITSGGGAPQVQVGLTGVAASDIDSTARSLVRVINRYASNTTVHAYYLTGPDDTPGKILIEEKGIGAAAFTIQTSDSQVSDMIYPEPPVSPSTTTESTSTNDVKQHWLMFSKSDQPEAVPGVNYFPVGAANSAILRVIPLQNSAVIIKEDGVYRFTGVDAKSFVVEELDLTVFCKAAESAAALGNQVYMLSNQGVVTITESGVQVISRDIEPLITPLFQNSSLSSYTFGWAYETEKLYCLSTITNVDDTAANQTLIYNWSTRTWVRDTFAVKSAIIEKTGDIQYFIKASDLRLFKERKSFTDSDLADVETSITITSISGSTVEFTSSTAPEVGWVIKQGTTGIAIDSLTTISGGYRAVLANEPPGSWAAGSADLFPSVGFDIKYHPWTGKSPELLKQVSEAAILGDDTPGASSLSALGIVYSSNFDQEEDEHTVETSGVGWGGAWGGPWGDASDIYGYRDYVPRNKQYCTRMYVGVKHRRALERIAVCGVAFAFVWASDRMGR
jgi:hypothetical protein